MILTVQFADGSKLQNQRSVRMKVDFRAKLNLEIDFYVLDYNIGIVLGIPFLQKYNPDINWYKHIVTCCGIPLRIVDLSTFIDKG